MMKQGTGRIINFASPSWLGVTGADAYTAAKGAVVSLTRGIASRMKLDGYSITCNAIAPGIFHTPMLMALPEEAQKSLAAAVPFPKLLGRPEQFASLARHIIENTYINGEVIRLDGALRMAPRTACRCRCWTSDDT